MTLLQADLGRQLAAGEGFTTLVNFPQVEAGLRAGGRDFDPKRPYPELYQAPLYALTFAGALAVVPAGWREAWFTAEPVAPDGFGADYFLLGLNLVLFWIAGWLTYDLGRRLFSPRVGTRAITPIIAMAAASAAPASRPRKAAPDRPAATGSNSKSSAPGAQNSC